jgi:hypothetical protein
LTGNLAGPIPHSSTAALRGIAAGAVGFSRDFLSVLKPGSLAGALFVLGMRGFGFALLFDN